MKKSITAILVMVALITMSSASAVASATEVTQWAEINQGISYEIRSDLTNHTHRLVMTILNIGESFSVNLGKGDLHFKDIRFYYEEKKISLIYDLNYSAYRFLIAKINEKERLEIFRLRFTKPFRISSYQIFKEKAYISLKKGNRQGRDVGGEIRTYDIPEKTYQTVVTYGDGFYDVVWGQRLRGWDEMFQMGVIVGIAPVSSPNWYFWWATPSRYMTVYSAKTGEKIKRIFLPANTKVEEIIQEFSQSCPGESFELKVRQSTWETRSWIIK